MNYLHYRVHAGPENIIKIILSNPANVRLLDTLNYYKYKAGRLYKSTNETTQDTDVSWKPPHKGEWHVIIGLKGQDAEVRASVQVLKG